MVKVDLVSKGDYKDVIYRTSYNVAHSTSETLKKELEKCKCNCGADTIITVTVEPEDGGAEYAFRYCCNTMKEFAAAKPIFAPYL